MSYKDRCGIGYGPTYDYDGDGSEEGVDITVTANRVLSSPEDRCGINIGRTDSTQKLR